MKILKNDIPGLIEIKPDIYNDERGFFLNCMNRSIKKITKINEFSQTSISCSGFSVFRGLHYQIHKPITQVVQCIKGRVIDIACDMRKSSSSFGKIFHIELNDIEKNMVYLPAGIAHGFLSLSDESVLLYHIHGEYDKSYERGIHYKSIDYDLPFEPEIINKRDENWPSFNNAEYFE